MKPGWQALQAHVDRYHEEKEILRGIAELAKQHPEWAKQEPQLKQYLERLTAA